jgi:type VI secretion system secreted protein Hcp
MPNAFLELADIEGESLDSQHQNEIEITGWSWGMCNGASMELGGDDDDHGSSAPHVGRLTINKVIDRATPKLMKYCLTGTAIDEAVLTLRKKIGGPDPEKDDVDRQFDYFVVSMENVMIKNLSWGEGGGGGDESAPVGETVVLKFQKVHMTYTGQYDSGEPFQENPFGWDLGQHQEHHHERKKRRCR